MVYESHYTDLAAVIQKLQHVRSIEAISTVLPYSLELM